MIKSNDNNFCVFSMFIIMPFHKWLICTAVFDKECRSHIYVVSLNFTFFGRHPPKQVALYIVFSCLTSRVSCLGTRPSVAPGLHFKTSCVEGHRFLTVKENECVRQEWTSAKVLCFSILKSFWFWWLICLYYAFQEWTIVLFKCCKHLKQQSLLK